MKWRRQVFSSALPLLPIFVFWSRSNVRAITRSETFAKQTRVHCLYFYYSFRFTINRTHCVNPLSRVFFICPNTVTILTRLKTSQSSPQYENLWLVGNQGFEGCEVNKTIDKKLIDCNNPLNLLYYEVIFKRYSADVSAPVFEPGNEYYFIGKTSSNRRLVSKKGDGQQLPHKFS